MIDLSQNIAIAQIVFALGVIAFAIVWKLTSKKSSHR